MDILDRADLQIEKAFDALDAKNPDHDTIKERIAGALAAAQVTRARVARDTLQKKFGKTEPKKLT
jgi:hypothetical protein